MLSKRMGFTLIELLVVIAIIAILAAILFPVFARAKAKARATACLSNVKQLNLTIKMYQSDWSDCYPSSWDWMGFNSDGSPVIPWAGTDCTHYHFYDACGYPTGTFDPNGGALTPYIQNLDIKVCPDWERGAAMQSQYQSYGMNPNMGVRTVSCADTGDPWYQHTWSYQPYPICEAIMSDPVAVITLADMEGSGWPLDVMYDTVYGLTWPAERHGGVFNCGFCDGHAGTGTVAKYGEPLTWKQW